MVVKNRIGQMSLHVNTPRIELHGQMSLHVNTPRIELYSFIHTVQ